MNTSFRYSFKDIFGQSCVDGNLALKFLNEEVAPKLSNGDLIELDFDGVRLMNSSFSNALFGNIFAKNGRQIISNIRVANARSNVENEIRAGISFGLIRFDENMAA